MEDAPKRQFSPLTFLVGFGVGTFVGVALALIAIASVQDNAPRTRPVGAVAAETPDPSAGGVPPTPDIRPRTKTALDVRIGPGTAYGVIGLLSRGEALEVVGRDASSEWLAIRFPPGSAARGWVPVSGLDGVSGIDRLAVALPTPLPRTLADFPTPSLGPSGAGGTAAAATRSAQGTPTPAFNAGPPDLFISRVSLQPDGRISVTVGNRGPGDLLGYSVFVTVRDLGSRSEQLMTPVGNLVVGASVTVVSERFRIEDQAEVQAIVDPFGSVVNERDRSNNMVQLVLAQPRTPTPTSTPVPAD